MWQSIWRRPIEGGANGPFHAIRGRPAQERSVPALPADALAASRSGTLGT
jgi:hypothetical protein